MTTPIEALEKIANFDCVKYCNYHMRCLDEHCHYPEQELKNIATQALQNHAIAEQRTFTLDEIKAKVLFRLNAWKENFDHKAQYDLSDISFWIDCLLAEFEKATT